MTWCNDYKTLSVRECRIVEQFTKEGIDVVKVDFGNYVQRYVLTDDLFTDERSAINNMKEFIESRIRELVLANNELNRVGGLRLSGEKKDNKETEDEDVWTV